MDLLILGGPAGLMAALRARELGAHVTLLGMRVEQQADLQLAYTTLTGAVGLAARRLVQELQLVPLAPTWSAAVPLSL